jgi:hypothetical protein
MIEHSHLNLVKSRTLNGTYSGSNSRFEGAGASPLIFATVLENGAANCDRCAKAGLTKLETAGLATEAARSCLEADLRGRMERLSDDMVKPRPFSKEQKREGNEAQLAKGR